MPTIPVNETETFYQLALSQVEGIGVRSAKKLVNFFGSAQEVFSTGTRSLLQVEGMGLPKAQAISNFNGFRRIDEECSFAQKNSIEILSFQDQNYPKRLTHCYDAPLVLFKKGDANLNAQKIVSIVGTRNMTHYGRRVTQELVESFKPHEITVVSGLARGVDIEAHKSSIEHALPTVAVLGHGLDRIYPSGHGRFAREIVESGGALLSEFFSGTNPDRENFPKRNRIVAGMSDATIVIESGFTGGSIITADLANSYNRDVFAVPGGIFDKMSSGCNRLIKSNRAAVLENINDLASIMGWQIETGIKSQQKKLFVELNPEETRLMNFLEEKGQKQIDEISLAIEMPTSLVMVHLLNLEMNGLVKSLPGKIYELT